jgi:hypothetical protein
VSGFIYLASPYTPLAGESVQARTDAACKAAARLMVESGMAVFSPIAHSHYVSDELPAALRLDHEFWMRQDLPILRAAAKVVVLRLPGWERSRGIRRELAVAAACFIPIEYIDP